jgi:predicted RNase H-like HicB family nuclease
MPRPNRLRAGPFAARYTPLVEWSDEDHCYVGTCPSLLFGGVHGLDRVAVYAELCEAVEEVIALIREDGHALPLTDR